MNLIQKGDFKSTDFSNDNSNNAGGITVKTGAGSAVGAAIGTAFDKGQLAAGSNVTLTGDGTSGNPYVVSANPAGALTFTAKDAVAAKNVVALRPDGKVQAIGEVLIEASLGAANTFNGFESTGFSITYHQTLDRVIVVFDNFNPNTSAENGVYYVVGTVNPDGSITFGARVLIALNSAGEGGTTTAIYDPLSDKVLVTTGSGTLLNANYLRVGTLNVDGTITFATRQTISTGIGTSPGVLIRGPTGVYLFACRIGNTGVARVVTTTVAGTASFGTVSTFNASSVGSINGVYHPVQNKFVLVYTEGSPGQAKAIVGTVSGTTSTWGLETAYLTATSGWANIVYDSVSETVICVASTNAGGAQAGHSRIGTVSGTTISFEPTVLFTPVGAAPTETDLAFDPVGNKFFIAYRRGVSLYTRSGSVEGGVLVWGAETYQEGSVTYTVSNVVVEYIPELMTSLLGRSVTLSVSNRFGTIGTLTPERIESNADNWFGVVQASAADGQTVAVDITTKTATGLSGLTTGARYYVADNGALTTTANGRFIGRALSDTKLRLARVGV